MFCQRLSLMRTLVLICTICGGRVATLSAADITIPPTVTIEGKETKINDSNSYIFENGGVLNVDTNGTAVGSSQITLSGTFSSKPGASGVIHVYGNTPSVNSNGLFVTGDTSGFVGKVVVGNATRDTAATRDWLVFETGGNSHGFANAEIDLRTKTNSGLLTRTQAGNQTFTLGTLTGSGTIRCAAAGATYKVGGMRTDASAVDVYHGYFLDNEASNPTLVKEGAGTWIWTGKLNVNQIGAVQVTGGTLQIGDYGHVYGADDFYYEQGTIGTGTSETTRILPAVGVTVNNATLAFGQSTNLTFGNAMTLTGGTLSNVNPNTSITLSGILTGSLNVGGTGTIMPTNDGNTLTSVTVNGGTLRLAGATKVTGATLTAAEGGTLLFGTNGPYTNAITGTGGTLAVASGFSTNLSGVVTGNMSIAGPGTLEMTNEASKVTATVKSGTLVMNGTAAGNSSLTLDGGTLNPNNTAKNLKIGSNGGTLRFSNMSVYGLSDVDADHPGTLTIEQTSGTNHYWAGCNLGDLSSTTYDFSNLKATIKVSGNSIVSLGFSRNFQNATFELATNNTKDASLHFARNPAEGFILGDLIGDGLVMTSKNPSFSTPTGAYKVTVGNLNHDSTFSGAFANNTTDGGVAVPTNIDVTKVGTGTWTLGAAAAGTVWDIDNAVRNLTVSGGSLVLARNAGKATAQNVSAAANTTLQIDEVGQEITQTLTMASDSTLAFSLTGKEIDAMLTVNTLAFDSNADMTFLLSDDFLQNITNTTTLNVLDTTTSTLTPEMFAGFVANNAVLNTYFIPTVVNGLFVLNANSAVLPEPSTWMILLLGLGMMFRRKKRSVL